MTTAAAATATTIRPVATDSVCAQIPIWVCGKELWISGVDRRTTVDEVVETLLGHPDKQYSITEKWRQVERPLSGDTRILKLWKTWGDAKAEVKLSLKKIHTDQKNSERTTSVNFTTKKKTRCYKSICSKYSQTIHPKRLVELTKNHGIERLLKLILVQGETIQNQISKLKDRQFEIEQLENEQLESRIDSLGTKYLADSYLGKHEEKNSGMMTECATSNVHDGTSIQNAKYANDVDKYDDYNHEDNDDNNNDEDEKYDEYYNEEITIEQDMETEIQELRNKIYFLDKIVKINKKLEKEEEHLVRLFINIERCKEDGTWPTTNTSDEPDLRFDLNRLKNENEKIKTEFDNNRKLLTRLENSLMSRRYHLKRLHDDFYDETNQYSDRDLPSIASCSVRSITQRALPYYTDTATTTTTNKPVLNTLV